MEVDNVQFEIFDWIIVPFKNCGLRYLVVSTNTFKQTLKNMRISCQMCKVVSKDTLRNISCNNYMSRIKLLCLVLQCLYFCDVYQVY